MAAPLRLVADIGGTNARFAMVDPDGALSAIEVLATDDHAGPAEAIEAYLERTGMARPAQAALAIAPAVPGDEVRMTNHRWAFSVKALEARLGLRRLRVINDFTALALSLPDLPAADLHQVGGGEPVPGAALAVVGPGTGLGVSGLLREGGVRVPISGEGGHVTLAGGDEFEARVVAHLGARFRHVSAERALSGEGLVNLCESVAALRGDATDAATPAEITRRALSGEDATCVRALDTFCALLGSVAGDLALTLGARGGVYIGGGIVPRLGAFLDRSPFRARFESKGRFASYLTPIPCFVIHAPHPALLGAAAALDAPPTGEGHP